MSATTFNQGQRESQALLQLAELLSAVPYGIELSEDRAATVRESLPEGQA